MAEKMRHLLGLDLRSLATFRVALGLLLLFDLAIRATDLIAHYTDAGVMPRQAVREFYGASWRWSIHSLSGSATWQVALFSLAACAAVALVLGHSTRLATVLSWVLLSSLHTRAPWVINGGDTLLRMLLFWSIFLPLGSVWSRDARRHGIISRNATYFSAATVALILQICLVYWSTGLFKWNENWLSGGAMGEIMAFDSYARPLAYTLLDHPQMLRWATAFTLALEIAGPLLLFFPWRTGAVRLLLITAFAVLHLGIENTMTVGLFSWACLSAWCVLLPGCFWDVLGNLRGNRHPMPLDDHRAVASREDVEARQNHARAPKTIDKRQLGWVATQLVVAGLLAYVIAWNVVTHSLWPRTWAGAVPIPKLLQRSGEALSLNQQWAMFYEPPACDGWFIVLARLEDGRIVDPVRNVSLANPNSWERPKSIIDQSPNHRWRKYRRNLVTSEHHTTQSFRRYYCEFLLRLWNAQHPDQANIAAIELYFMQELEPTVAPHAPTRQRLLYQLERSTPPMPAYLREAWKALESSP